MSIFEQAALIFNHPLFNIVGGISVSITFIAITYKVVCFFWGVTPLMLRLGISLWKRKVAIFGDESSFSSLKLMLIDSGIFKEKNIIKIDLIDLAKAKKLDIFLVDWNSSKDHINQIFDFRPNNQTPVIIFASPGKIPEENLSDIANRSNTVIVNFRGRLINDLLTSLVTTSYDKS
ncbi:hypothetical protein ICV01_06330 [Polynucleobacter sp. MWH-Spelu-300-X4]|uniref:hypothetical protein n=1 Tax=Polynucleobacter sp. MWH-Spelu-300-X4 TaxID=2689109 RepID=UPI001BFE7B40|nr:hypothetical protein [Polynucleobacter sp. MWH-Spelu-300-X4]QWD79265.1 hypothetical protein ICV01_06330 [Polynucleobacter sp. MWH-Spelu-300-X4]